MKDEKYCFNELEQSLERCSEQCELCKEYDKLMNVELEDLYQKINGYWSIDDVFSTFSKDIESEMNVAAEQSEHPIAFKNGAQWVLDKLKQIGINMQNEI